MLTTTSGIVLHSFKYGDSGIIARILTREMGMQSFLIQGAHKPRSRYRANLFQPLSLLEMVIYYKEKPGLQRIREIHNADPLNNLREDIRKISLCLFTAEVLLHTFRHQEENQPEVFDFIYQKIQQLDQLENHLSIFHIHFLLQLCSFLGFAPGKNYSPQNCFFNLKEGLYQDQLYLGCLDKNQSKCFFHLTQTETIENIEQGINNEIRKELLMKTLDYYRMHLEGFGEIKSIAILEEVLSQK